MKLNELFKAQIQDDSNQMDGGAILEGSLNDMVEDHLPENTRVWKIQWVMSEDGNDAYRPQFIFARTKDEAAHKFTERMRHPELGLVAIESIVEVAFDSINEGDVIRPFGDKVLWSKKMRDHHKDKRSDDEKYDDAVTKQSKHTGYDDFGDGTNTDAKEFGRTKYGKKNWSKWFDDDGIEDGPFNEGDVVDFPGKVTSINKNISDQDKYDMAVRHQQWDKEGGRPSDVDLKADPTQEEMEQVIISNFDIEAVFDSVYPAFYWFASDFNNGPGSNLHDDTLNNLGYKPGPMVTKIEDEDELAQELYYSLYDYFSSKGISEGRWDIKGAPAKDKAMLTGLIATGNFTAAAYVYARIKMDQKKNKKKANIDRRMSGSDQRISRRMHEAHRWAQSHGKRGRSEREQEEIEDFLWENVQDIKEMYYELKMSEKEIAAAYEVLADDIEEMMGSERWSEGWNDETEEWDSVDEAKQHHWAGRHGKRGTRTEEHEEEIWEFLMEHIEDIKELMDNGRTHKQIAIAYEVTEEDIDGIYESDAMLALYAEEEGDVIPDYTFNEAGKKKKKKKKKANVKNNFGIKPAEKSTKYDPPQTNYGKNVSARRGFVG